MRPSEMFNTRGLSAVRYAARLARETQQHMKSGEVGGGGFNDTEGWGDELAAADGVEFVGLVNEVSVFGQLSALMRRLPINCRVAAQNARASVGFVAPGVPIPVSALGFDPLTLPALKLGGLLAVSDELLRDGSRESEMILRRDMQQAVAEGTDHHFLDPGEAAIAGAQPASVTNGVAPITSSGDPATDVRELIESFAGDLGRAYFVTSPSNAARIGLYRDAAGNYPFPGCGPRGGDILGVPVIASQNCPTDSDGEFLALIDPTAVCYADDGIEFAASKQAMVIQSSAPEGATPATSMFQADATAIKTIRRLNWQVARSCIAWTWADYFPASSS